MRWRAEIDCAKKRRFEIYHDERVGYYFYVFENGVDTHDYLQDTLQDAMDQAYEEFGVPYDVWRKVE